VTPDYPQRRKTARERIIAAEIKKLELRQERAAKRAPVKPDATRDSRRPES